MGAFRKKSIAETFPLTYEECKVNTTRPSGSLDTGPLPAGTPTVSEPGKARPPKSLDQEGVLLSVAGGGHVTDPDDGDPQGLILIASVL